MLQSFQFSGDISSISGSDSDTSDSDDNEDHLSPYSDPATIDKLHQNQQNKAGNGDDEEDSIKRNHRSYPKVFFTNSQGQLISVHRCILHGKKVMPISVVCFCIFKRLYLLHLLHEDFTNVETC